MTIGSIVVFGNSIQDNGNLIKTLEIPGTPYDRGRFNDWIISYEYPGEILKERYQTRANINIINYTINSEYILGKNLK